jgi:tRNA pseudouridine38-40 synthase
MTENDPLRLRLEISYDGTAFSGWGIQPVLRTVQGELEGALATIFGAHRPAPTLTVAGRTDAGVHALGQVAHLDLTAEQWLSLDAPLRGKKSSAGTNRTKSLARMLNGLAGHRGEIHVRAVTIAPTGFDARFSAIWRRYEYRIADLRAVRNPLMRKHTLWYPSTLDVGEMSRAAESLTGLHDWASYCKPRERATTIRTLQEFTWYRADDGVLIAHLRADAFCHNMVRALVGATVAVGEGKLGSTELVDLRDDRVRTSIFKVLPPTGLALMEIGYPEDSQMGARAELSRARRDQSGSISETASLTNEPISD